MFIEELKNHQEWEDFLKISPEGTIFHSLKWREVIRKSFPYSALYLTIKDENGKVVGICPGFIISSMYTKFYCSTPHSDYGGPVIAEHWIKNASFLFPSLLQSFCSEKGISYTKMCFIDDRLARPFQSRLSYVDTNKGMMEIDLKATPSELIWNKILSKNRRQKIKRLERDGFQAQIARTKSDLRDFYDLYYKNMKYIGAFPHSYEFMENMWMTLYPWNLRIWLVEKEKRIGGIVVFKYGQKTYWQYAGIAREESEQYSIIPYLLWKEIKTAEEEGYRYVSLGGTPNDSQNSYYIQKSSFGSSFYQQKTVWHPISCTGRILLQTRAKIVSTWKTIRNFLPLGFKSIIEKKFSKL